MTSDFAGGGPQNDSSIEVKLLGDSLLVLLHTVVGLLLVLEHGLYVGDDIVLGGLLEFQVVDVAHAST